MDLPTNGLKLVEHRVAVGAVVRLIQKLAERQACWRMGNDTDGGREPKGGMPRRFWPKSSSLVFDLWVQRASKAGTRRCYRGALRGWTSWWLWIHRHGGPIQVRAELRNV